MSLHATRFRATLRRAWPVLLSYGVLSVWGAGCLVASLVLTSGGLGVGAGGFAVVVGILVATAAGHVAGNLLGLARLRLAVVVVVFTAALIAAGLSGALVGTFALFFVVAVLAALGGYLGIASRLDVVASWFPLSFAVGGAIVWMNFHSGLATFHSGAKHALWDPFTMVCLSGAVFLNLVFLATRHSLGLTVWQEVGRPAMPNASSEEAVAVARPGRGSLVVLLVFSVLVLGATALISPYLFRTHAAEEGDRSAQDGHDKGKTPSKGNDGRSKGQQPSKGEQPSKGDPLGNPDGDAASQASSMALEMGLRLMGWLLAIALALLICSLVGFPPMRRAFLLRHLERPIWPVSPTTRVINLWRRALASLTVVGIAPAAGEAPRDFARRASRELETAIGCGAPQLDAAAALVEKIDYEGRGLGAGEERTMREAIGVVVKAIEARAGAKKRLAAAWGPAPEVEP